AHGDVLAQLEAQLLGLELLRLVLVEHENAGVRHAVDHDLLRELNCCRWHSRYDSGVGAGFSKVAPSFGCPVGRDQASTKQPGMGGGPPCATCRLRYAVGDEP